MCHIGAVVSAKNGKEHGCRELLADSCKLNYPAYELLHSEVLVLQVSSIVWFNRGYKLNDNSVACVPCVGKHGKKRP